MARKKENYGPNINTDPRRPGIFYVRIYYAGVVYKRRAASLSHARDLVHEIKAAILKGEWPPKPKPKPVLFEDLLDDYREWARREDRAIINGEGCYERLLTHFGGRRADTISLAEVERFKHGLGERLSVATVNRNLSLLRAIYNRAIRHGRIENSPLRNLRLDAENNMRRRFLAPDEEARLLPALPARLRPLAIVALHTGMRLGELLALRWQDVDFAAGTILIREAKAGEGRLAWMSPVASKTLRALRQDQTRAVFGAGGLATLRERYVFSEARGAARTNLWRYWHVALRKARIADLRFHDLRHTFGSRLVNRDVPAYTVKELLGHKTLRMTERYCHLEPETLRQAVARLVR